MLDSQGAVGAQILIVHNDDRVRASIARLVEATAARIATIEAGDEQAALRLARTCHPQLAIVDITFADQTIALGLVAKLSHECRIPVIAMSTLARMGRHALDNGATAFLDKGVSPERIIELIAGRLDRPVSETVTMTPSLKDVLRDALTDLTDLTEL